MGDAGSLCAYAAIGIKCSRLRPMRVIYILLALITVCTWFGIELRKIHRDFSHLLLGIAGLLTVLAVAAFFGIH